MCIVDESELAGQFPRDTYLIVPQMRMLHYHPQDQHRKLILQCDSLFVWNARWKAFQRSIHIQNDLIVFQVMLQFDQ